MPRPGVSVSLLDTPGVVSLPTDTGVWFALGLTDRGPVTPVLIQSLNDFVQRMGDRQTYSVLYDAVDLFFREGGNRVYITRVVGPAATTGIRNLLDAGAGISLVVSGIGPGAWSANYKVAVIAASGGFTIQVTDASNVVLEDSGTLATQQAAIAWANNSKYIRIALGATALNPAPVAATALSAGNDDRASITDTQWQTALDRNDASYGPGQVSQPGRVTTAAYNQLTAHALANNRVALLDAADTPTVATLLGAFSSSRSRFAAGFAPWIVIPGLTLGTIRTVPPSAMAAGIIARNDPSLGPNRPSAGNAGVSNYATDLSQPDWNATDRGSLNVANVNVIRRFNGIRIYGWRSTVDPNADANWIDFGNGRLYMSLSAELSQVGENYMFEEIDGQEGVTIAGFHDALAGVLLGHWNNGELFGGDSQSAFDVDTGPAVNTLVTIAANELHAVCYVKMAPFAEYIPIQIVKRTLP